MKNNLAELQEIVYYEFYYLLSTSIFHENATGAHPHICQTWQDHYWDSVHV